MERLTAALLLYVLGIQLAVSAVTHLMPLLGGRYLNPVPAWSGDATWVWELTAALIAGLAGLWLDPGRENHGRGQ